MNLASRWQCCRRTNTQRFIFWREANQVGASVSQHLGVLPAMKHRPGRGILSSDDTTKDLLMLRDSSEPRHLHSGVLFCKGNMGVFL